MAFVRGRFCELAAELCALDPTEQYLLGMLSLLPAMLRRPMAELTPALALRHEILQALQGANLPESSLLQWLVCHEHGDWAACDAVVRAYRFNQELLVRCYAQAVLWAEAALHFSS